MLPNGRSFSKTSSMFGGAWSNTCSMDGPRPVLRSLAYAWELIEAEETNDEPETRRSIWDERRPSLSRCFSASASGGASKGRRDGDSGIADSPDDTVLVAVRPGTAREDVDDAAEDGVDKADSRVHFV